MWVAGLPPPEAPVEVWPAGAYPYDILTMFITYWSFTGDRPLNLPPGDISASVLGLPPVRGSRVLGGWNPPGPVAVHGRAGQTVVAMVTHWTDNVAPDVAFVFSQKVLGGPPLSTPRGTHYTRLVLTWVGVVGAPSCTYKVAFYR